MKHIILIGFMGAGKSTMGKLIANKLGCSFIDTDTYIEKKEGRSIQDIFTDDGEDYFRSAETDVLRELLKADEKYVLALGGGTPLLEENRVLIKEAEALLSSYISKVENNKFLEKPNKVLKEKYKRLRQYSIIMTIFFAISFIINFA